jgi:secondary thiamine-phosphate synthase enzyme
MLQISITTRERTEMVEITRHVVEAVRASGVKEGIATVYVPHTTASVTINENADEDVVADVLAALDRLAPRRASYRHGEGNADAHIKSVLVGQSVSVPVRGGSLGLGTWQGIFFCEFDGPRTRQVWVDVRG